MELAGIIGMGTPQEGIRPDLLKYIFVKGPEVSDTRTGSSTFWVFKHSHGIVVPATTSAEPHEEQVAAVPSDTGTEVSAPKHRKITDFFPRSSLATHGSGETRRAPSIPFITPHPSARFSEVPVVFQVQSDCVAEDYLDPTHPLFKHEVSERSSEPSIAIDRSGASSEADAESDSAEVDVEQYWIEKDEERLAVISNMEKTMARIKEEQDNTAKAFQMAANANQKLQAELEKKNSTLSQVEDVMNDLLHNLDATDMDKEKLEQELANRRIDCKYQIDRAEESMTLVQGGPSQETIAELIQAKADAESRITIQRMEWESEKDSLESQLKERCNSVARLTETLSRVADSDRWQEVREELEELTKRAGNLPEDLKVALRECEKLLSEKASLQEALQQIKDFDLRSIRELKQKCKDKEVSERALKECLKRAFERMVRCSLYLENEGYSAFDIKHQEICEEVSELTGEDYQEPLLNYYAEHDVQSEFNFGDDGVTDDEEVVFDSQRAQAGNEELDVRGNDQESTLDLSPTPTPGTTEDESATSNTTQEQEAQESPTIQEARNEREVINNVESETTAADQVFPAVPGPFGGPRDPRANAFSNGGQEFWSNTSFATVENNPFASNAASAADTGVNTITVPPVFNLFAKSQSAEVETPASETSEAEQDIEPTDAVREAAPSTTNSAFSPPQLQEFNFGGNISPAAFAASFPASTPAPGPPSNGIFSFGE